jgi:MinD-like ATPase involved in chromosome partitioning or flagellar assembly
MLRAPSTAIVVVTDAEPSRIDQSREFMSALVKAGLSISALVVNRVMAEIPDASEISSAKVSAALRRKLKRNLADYSALKSRENISIRALRESIPGGAVLIATPDLGREPRTIADLAEIGASMRPA